MKTVDDWLLQEKVRSVDAEARLTGKSTEEVARFRLEQFIELEVAEGDNEEMRATKMLRAKRIEMKRALYLHAVEMSELELQYHICWLRNYMGLMTNRWIREDIQEELSTIYEREQGLRRLGTVREEESAGDRATKARAEMLPPARNTDTQIWKLKL